MKVVVNACRGKFNLSDACIEELAARKGHKAYRYSFSLYGFRRCREGQTRDHHIFLLDIDQEEIAHIEAKNHFISLFENDEKMRTDPDLISLIEKNGAQWASGDYASLKIIEIPDDVDWVIGEDEGKEWVEERHRAWA